ncbi:MAG: aldehyde dehydrogenase family protein, partial [Armatimonadetes bacterium]|nr:aldehyde dehydrogenase family protein [Armatimonadota bacterium]
MATESSDKLEQRIHELGGGLIAAARERSSAFWAREHWEETLLRKLMVNERFRIQALRFVDVLPALKEDEALVQHLREYFGEETLPLPGAARWGMEAARGGVAAQMVAAAVRAALHGLASRFIGGATGKEVLQTVDRLRREGMACSLDLLGEAVVSEAEAREYEQRYLALVGELAPAVGRWKQDPVLDRVGERAAPRLNLSVKVSALFSQLSPVDPAGCVTVLKERLRPILLRARQAGAFVCLDMEQYDSKGIILRLFREILMEPELRDWPDAGLAMQAYLRDTEVDLASMIDWARQRGTPVTVRLVRGAYWDYETVIARQHGWAVPVWSEKWETDRNYERCVRLLIENHPHIEAAFATHNARSLAVALAMAETRGLEPGQFEIQMLHGMADPLKDAVAGLGHRVRVYVPFGEVLPGMAYLVRRLLENTASQSFLRMGFADDLPAEALLAAPQASPILPPPAARASAPVSRELPPFRNEPERRFTAAAERERFAAAIAQVRKELGREYPVLLHGREQRTDEWFASINPARPGEVIGRVAAANEKDAATAVRSCRAAFPAWRDRTAADRAQILLEAARRIRRRRDEFAAWQILEAGKTWREADADVTEAIDFLEYYVREAIRLSRVLPLHAPGEENSFFYQPRGVCVVIPPWNFPLAITTGLTAA